MLFLHLIVSKFHLLLFYCSPILVYLMLFLSLNSFVIWESLCCENQLGSKNRGRFHNILPPLTSASSKILSLAVIVFIVYSSSPCYFVSQYVLLPLIQELIPPVVNHLSKERLSSKISYYLSYTRITPQTNYNVIQAIVSLISPSLFSNYCYYRIY